MRVTNCKQCGRMFNYIGGMFGSVCPDCRKELEKKLAAVNKFVKENPKASVEEISDNCGVECGQIRQWVNRGYVSGYEL